MKKIEKLDSLSNQIWNCSKYLSVGSDLDLEFLFLFVHLRNSGFIDPSHALTFANVQAIIKNCFYDKRTKRYHDSSKKFITILRDIANKNKFAGFVMTISEINMPEYNLSETELDYIILSLVQMSYEETTDQTIYDPACGTSFFLVESLKDQ